MARFKQIILAVLFTWALACFLQFPLSTVVTAIGSPRWLPLPWSAMTDFVSVPNGHIYISLGFYNRVLCYDGDGRFVGSYPVPETKHGVRLAVDDKGHLYYWALGKIILVDEDWKTQVLAEKVGCESWSLDETYKPICRAEAQQNIQMPGRAISHGEVLFAASSKERESFRCTDGSMLERSGWNRNSLLIRSEDGKIGKTLGTPWYLSWAVFPFPASLALLVTALIIFLCNGTKKPQQGNNEGKIVGPAFES